MTCRAFPQTVEPCRNVSCEEDTKPIGRSSVVRFPESEIAALKVGEIVVTLKLTAGPCVFEALGVEEYKGRYRLRWADGCAYHARRSAIQRRYGGVAVTARTSAFRQLIAQVGREDRVLELGCSAGEATRRLANRAAAVVAVDKAEQMLNEARRRAPMAIFVLADCLREDVAARAVDADVVFLDLGGRQALGRALQVLRKVFKFGKPRLVVVKSVELANFAAANYATEPVDVDLDEFFRRAFDFYARVGSPD